MGLEAIDQAFIEHFGTFEASEIQIGTPTSKYQDALVCYTQSCQDISQDVVKRLKEAGLPGDTTFEDDVKTALAWSNSKIPLPIPTRSFVAWIFELFGSVRLAIQEVNFYHFLL